MARIRRRTGIQQTVDVDLARENLESRDDRKRLAAALLLGKHGEKTDLNLLADTLRGDSSCLVQFASATAIGMIAGRLQKGDAQLPRRVRVDEFAARYRVTDLPVMNALQTAAEFHEFANNALSAAAGSAVAEIKKRLEGLGDWGDRFERIATALAIHEQHPQKSFQDVIDLADRVNTQHFESDKDLTTIARGVAIAYSRLLGRNVTEVDLQLSADADAIRSKLSGTEGLAGFDAAEYVEKWRRKLAEAKALPPTGGNILSIYGTSTDRVYTLDDSNIGRFFEAAEINPQNPLTNAEIAIIEGKKPADPKNARGAAVVVLWAMKHSGDKNNVDANTEKELVACMRKAKVGSEDRAGGASSNIANNLPREERVTVCSQEVHPTLKGKFGGNVRRLRVQQTGFTRDKRVNDDTDNEAAITLGHVIELRPGINIELPVEDGGTLTIGVDRMDRHIFGAPSQQGAAPAKPYIIVSGKTQAPNDAIVEQIGREFPVIFLNGMHYLKEQADEKIMRSQIKALKAGGAFLHCPLSRVKEGSMDFLTVIQNTDGQGVDSIGMNHSEVITVAKEVRRVVNQGMTVDESGTPAAIFENALAIARALNTRVYVHGENFDVIIRRNATTGVLRDEVNGALYSKCAMIPKLLTGVVDPAHHIYDNVKLEGLTEMLDLATHIAGNYGVDPKELLRRGYTLTPLKPKAGGWAPDENWSAVLIPPKHIYRQREVLYPTGAGDCAEANDTVYAFKARLAK